MELSRSHLNFIVDSLLLAIFLGLNFSAVVVRFVFPPSVEALGWQLWGLNLDGWINMQFGLVAAMALAVLVHLMLHWSWVCGFVVTRLAKNKKAKLDDGTQTIYGVGLLIVILNLLGLAIAAAALSIQGPA